MKSTGILMRPELLEATRKGVKTVTRRLVKPQPWCLKCPYGGPGDELYVKEPFTILSLFYENRTIEVRYDDDEVRVLKLTPEEHGKMIKWKKPFTRKSPLFMFRSLARTKMEITGVRVERIQDITEEEAKREGVAPLGGHVPYAHRLGFMHTINTLRPGSWERNDWFWVIDYKLKP